MRTLSLLIKPASGRCNMRCRYCFYADVANSRDTADYGVMDAETSETLVRKCLAEAGDACSFGFQGGEPTLAGLDFFRRFVEFEKRHNHNGVAIHHAIQTNGLNLDEAWAAFFAENKFLVGLSVDAGKQLHDDMRPDASGRGTHKRCLDAARLLRDGGVEFNILSVLTRYAASHPDRAYRHYKERGFRHLQFIPCLDGLGDAAGARPHSLDAESYGRFLCRVFDLWYRDFIGGEYVSIRMFDNYVHMLAGHPPENCAMAGRCQTHMLVEGDGTVFPCDFYAVDEYRLGNINDDSLAEMLGGERAQAFVRASHHVHEDCRGCEFFGVCRGGCRRDREPVIGGVPGLNVHCRAYRMFFAHALPRMRDLAARLF